MNSNSEIYEDMFNLDLAHFVIQMGDKIIFFLYGLYQFNCVAVTDIKIGMCSCRHTQTSGCYKWNKHYTIVCSIKVMVF